MNQIEVQKVTTTAHQTKSPPPRLEGEGQGGGVDKERAAKPRTQLICDLPNKKRLAKANIVQTSAHLSEIF